MNFDEYKKTRYWLHISIISFITLLILQWFTGGEMLTVKNVLYSIPLLAVADIIADKITGY